MSAALLAGLLFGASLIVAFGPQNTFVLRQGLLRAHVPVVVVLAIGSDVVLVAAGVAGSGAAVDRLPAALEVVRTVGAAFLLVVAALALRRAWHPPGGQPGGRPPAASAAAAASVCLAFTWLNPAVYLDTLVVIGSVAGTHGTERWWFGAGAALASVGWFATLGFGARLVAPMFDRPGAWRVVDVVTAVIMVVTAARLLSGA